MRSNFRGHRTGVVEALEVELEWLPPRAPLSRSEWIALWTLVAAVADVIVSAIR